MGEKNPIALFGSPPFFFFLRCLEKKGGGGGGRGGERARKGREVGFGYKVGRYGVVIRGGEFD